MIFHCLISSSARKLDKEAPLATDPIEKRLAGPKARLTWVEPHFCQTEGVCSAPGWIPEFIPSQAGWCPLCRIEWWSCCFFSQILTFAHVQDSKLYAQISKYIYKPKNSNKKKQYQNICRPKKANKSNITNMLAYIFEYSDI